MNSQYIQVYLRFFDERSGLLEVKVEITLVDDGALPSLIEVVNLEKVEQEVNLFFCYVDLLHLTIQSQNLLLCILFKF